MLYPIKIAIIFYNITVFDLFNPNLWVIFKYLKIGKKQQNNK